MKNNLMIFKPFLPGKYGSFKNIVAGIKALA
jgi:hypothetical protein